MDNVAAPSCCGRIRLDAEGGPPPDNINPFSLKGFLALEAYLLLGLLRQNGPIKESLLKGLTDDVNQFNAEPGRDFSWLINKFDQRVKAAGVKSVANLPQIVTAAQVNIGERVRTTMRNSWTPNITAWDKSDTATMEWLSRNTGLYAGKYFEVNLRDRARKILTRDYSLYGDNIDKFKLRVKDGLVSFVDATDRYWEIVATNALNHARSYSAIWGYNQAGIHGYEIVAVLDSRTTRICQVLDGKQFVVAEAYPHFDRIAAAREISELEQISPMLTQNKDGTINAYETILPETATAQEFASVGAMFPPFHWGCRSTVKPVIT